MTERVQKAEHLIEQLSAEELSQFATWFADYQDSLWEKQIEQNAKAGKLGPLVETADREIDAGRFRQL